MLVDVHAHYLPKFLIAAFDAAGRKPSLTGFPEWTPELALAQMDHIAVDRSILSLSAPGVHFGDDTGAAALARSCNDYAASLAAPSDNRLGAFAALPLPFIDGALAEIDYALGTLSLEGVGLLASYGERFLGDPIFDPVMAELDRRGSRVFVHPMGHPTSRALQLPMPIWMIEYPFDTTRAAVNLIVSGTLTRFPNIRFILAHAGGALPFLQARLASIALIDTRFAHLDETAVLAQIASFYYETAQACGKASLAALAEVTRPDHILFGSDFPYCNPSAIDAMTDKLDYLPGGREALARSGEQLFGGPSIHARGTIAGS